jgi:hypothetical protein
MFFPVISAKTLLRRAIWSGDGCRTAIVICCHTTQQSHWGNALTESGKQRSIIHPSPSSPTGIPWKKTIKSRSHKKFQGLMAYPLVI